MLEQKLNSEQNDEAQLPSSPNNGNTHVGCRFSFVKLKRIKIFKSEAQEMKFYMIGTTFCIIIYIILSTIRELKR